VIRSISAALLCSAVLVLAGCGGGGEKGKNKDKDVPESVKGEPSA